MALKRPRPMAGAGGASAAAGSQGAPARRTRPRKSSKALLYKHLPVGGFPKSKTVKLKYVDVITMDPGAAVPVYYYYRANSLFDPDLTGTGHQPRGFDQWAAVYDHYTVMSSTIRVQAVPKQTVGSTIIPCVYGVCTDDDPTWDHGTVADIIESRQSRGWRYASNATEGSSTGKRPSITSHCDVAKFYGTTPKELLNNPRFNANTSANPTEGVYHVIWAGPMDISYNPSSVSMLVEIWFTATFTEPKTLPSS